MSDTPTKCPYFVTCRKKRESQAIVEKKINGKLTYMVCVVNHFYNNVAFHEAKRSQINRFTSPLYLTV